MKRIRWFVGLFIFFAPVVCAMNTLVLDQISSPEITPPASPVKVFPERNFRSSRYLSPDASPTPTPPLSAHSCDYGMRQRSSSLCARTGLGLKAVSEGGLSGMPCSISSSLSCASDPDFRMVSPQMSSLSSSPERVRSFSPDSSSSDDEDDLHMARGIFKQDQKEDSTCISLLKCCLESLCALGKVVSSSCCFCPRILSSKPDRWSFQVLKAYYKDEMEHLVEEDIVQGEGAYVFWDLRGSTKYYETVRDTGKKAAQFMKALTNHLYLPVCAKYNSHIVGTGGDGPLILRMKYKGENDFVVVNDMVRAAIELVVRYPEVKERLGLKGPRWCGAGVEYGDFWLYLSPITKGLPPFIPSFVSESITKAFLCEQGNKEQSTALTITKQTHDMLSPESLKDVFRGHKIKTKNGESLPVYSATLESLQRLWRRAGHEVFSSGRLSRHEQEPRIATPLPEKEQAHPVDELIIEDV